MGDLTLSIIKDYILTALSIGQKWRNVNMEYEKVKQWLDDVVDMAEHSKSLEEFNTSICTTNLIRNIQMYKGIDIVSDVMNIKLTAEPRKYDDESEYIRSSFVYRSVEFFQLNEVKDGIVCQK